MSSFKPATFMLIVLIIGVLPMLSCEEQKCRKSGGGWGEDMCECEGNVAHQDYPVSGFET